jgi:hypothetical protein
METDDDDELLQQALAMSRQENKPQETKPQAQPVDAMEDDDEELRLAMQMSQSSQVSPRCPWTDTYLNGDIASRVTPLSSNPIRELIAIIRSLRDKHNHHNRAAILWPVFCLLCRESIRTTLTSKVFWRL